MDFLAFDLWEESDTSERKQTSALQRQTRKEENSKWKTALRNAAVSNNEGEVKELLASRSASLQCDRWHQTNVVAALGLVTSERMVKAFSDSSPDFFQDMWAPAALLGATERGRQHQVALLLGLGVPADAQAPWTQMLSLHVACARGHAACARLLLAHGADAARQVNGRAPLHYAAESGSRECVDALLDIGVDVDAGDTDGRTALHWAASAGAVDCVRALVARGADLEARERFLGITPLLMAARVNTVHGVSKNRTCGEHLLCVKELVRLGADVCATDTYGNNALFLALINRASDVVKYLIDGVVDLSKKNKEGETALHVAASCGVEFVRDLVTAGIDVNCKRNDGKTPLHCALQSWDASCAKELVVLGADIVACDNDGWTPLHSAARARDLEIIRLLLDGGCDTALANKEGETALHLASYWGSCECVRALLDRGADPNAKANDGKSPVHWAAQRWDPNCLAELQKHGADMNARDENGWTILHYAADVDSIEVIQFLSHLDFDLEARTARDRSALHLAAKAGRVLCVCELLRLGALVSARDSAGRTPLHEAARRTSEEPGLGTRRWTPTGAHEEVARSLLERGADLCARDAEGHAPADLAVTLSMEHLLRRWGIAT